MPGSSSESNDATKSCLLWLVIGVVCLVLTCYCHHREEARRSEKFWKSWKARGRTREDLRRLLDHTEQQLEDLKTRRYAEEGARKRTDEELRQMKRYMKEGVRGRTDEELRQMRRYVQEGARGMTDEELEQWQRQVVQEIRRLETKLRYQKNKSHGRQ